MGFSKHEFKTLDEITAEELKFLENNLEMANPEPAAVLKAATNLVTQLLQWHGDECPICGEDMNGTHEPFCAFEEMRNVLAGRLPGDSMPHSD